jgi:hypothetical protein
LLASDGRVNSQREYIAKDDIEAIELAGAIYQIYVEGVTPGYGFEVWQRVRLVARELNATGVTLQQPTTATTQKSAE